MHIEINEAQKNNCTRLGIRAEYYPTHIRLLEFDILVMDSDETKDSLFISNKGNIINPKFFAFINDYRVKRLSNKILFINFKVFNECLNQEYYLKKNFKIAITR
jgi:hypothetical protein